jgi:hypothetical protein
MRTRMSTLLTSTMTVVSLTAGVTAAYTTPTSEAAVGLL